MDTPRTDFLAQYRAISAKLKKRFLRKPNVTEASADFLRLARTLENDECPHYAAFCYLAVARCEHTIGNPVYEAQYLHQAARLFLEAENLNHELLCPSWGEHLQASISAFRDCIKVHLENNQPSLAAAMCIELGEALRKLDRTRESIPYFFKASDLHISCHLDYINDLKRIGDCRLDLEDYDGALTVLTEAQVIAEKVGVKDDGDRLGAFVAILNEVEVTRALLLILMKPPRDKLNPEHEKLLQRYENCELDSNPVDYIDEEMHLLLQSLVIAVCEKDEEALLFLAKIIEKQTNIMQQDILSKILDKYRNFNLVAL